MYTSMDFVHAQRGQKKGPDHGKNQKQTTNFFLQGSYIISKHPLVSSSMCLSQQWPYVPLPSIYFLKGYKFIQEPEEQELYFHNPSKKLNI